MGRIHEHDKQKKSLRKTPIQNIQNIKKHSKKIINHK